MASDVSLAVVQFLFASLIDENARPNAEPTPYVIFDPAYGDDHVQDGVLGENGVNDAGAEIDGVVGNNDELNNDKNQTDFLKNLINGYKYF